MNLPNDELKSFCLKYKISLLILFGSYGTAKFNNNSDVDLAVIGEDLGLIKLNQMDILNELAKIFNNREIDLIVLNYADSLLKFNIANDGKPIYEKEKGLFQIFQVRAMSEHNDGQKFYQLDKEYIDNYIREDDNSGKQRVSPPEIK